MTRNLFEAMERIDHLEAEVDMLKRELGHNVAADAVGRVNRRWRLTYREAQILLVLHQRKGALVNKEGLLSAMYGGADDVPEIKIIDVFVCKVRAKVGDGFLETVWGHGYRLTPAGIAQVDELLGADIVDVARVEVRPRPTHKKGARQALVLATLSRQGPMDISALFLKLPAGEWSSTHPVRNILASARKARRVRVVDWRPGADGLRRAIYEVTLQGVGYVRLLAPELLDIPA